MKTARYYGIEDIRCEELPLPNCGEKDVLIKVAYAGICGSDLHIYKKACLSRTSRKPWDMNSPVRS